MNHIIGNIIGALGDDESYSVLKVDYKKRYLLIKKLREGNIYKISIKEIDGGENES